MAASAICIDILAKGLFETMNGDNMLFNTQIEEYNLTMNQSLKDMKLNRIKWSTVDDTLEQVREGEE